MTRIAISVLLACSTIAITVPVAAQALPQAGEAMGGVDTDTAARAVTEFDFEADQVTGDPMRPLEQSVRGERHPRRGSLIRIRPNFVPEMIRTVEEL